MQNFTSKFSFLTWRRAGLRGTQKNLTVIQKWAKQPGPEGMYS